MSKKNNLLEYINFYRNIKYVKLHIVVDIITLKSRACQGVYFSLNNLVNLDPFLSTKFEHFQKYPVSENKI